MRRELEYEKKMALIVKLFHAELISEKEYGKVRRKLFGQLHDCRGTQ